MPVLKHTITCVACATRIAPTVEARVDKTTTPTAKNPLHVSTERVDEAATRVFTRAGSSGRAVSQEADYKRVNAEVWNCVISKCSLSTPPVNCKLTIRTTGTGASRCMRHWNTENEDEVNSLPLHQLLRTMMTAKTPCKSSKLSFSAEWNCGTRALIKLESLWHILN